MAETRELADGSTLAATHRRPPAAPQFRMAGHRAFAGMAVRDSTALRAAWRLPVPQRRAPMRVPPERIRVAVSAPHARREAVVEPRDRSPAAGSAAVTRRAVVAAGIRPAATAAATDKNVIANAQAAARRPIRWPPFEES